MSQANGYWANQVSNNLLASIYSNITNDVHVLLVDHDRESLLYLANMLQMRSYRVTIVELASAALAMLANAGEQFDVVIANIHSPDYQSFRLLETAASMNMVTVLMSIDDEVHLARRALELGASLYVKRPLTTELAKYLWQLVVKERLRNAVASILAGERIRENNRRSTDSGEDSLAKANSDLEDNRNNKGKRKARNQSSSDLDEMNNNQSGPKRKVCTEWTDDLHEKFINAVTELGEGKCYPKDILERMNVPGLTRMQVASHLQKCRNDNWRTLDKRRTDQGSPDQPNADADASEKKESSKRFGTMPALSCFNYQPKKPKNQAMAAGSKAPANGEGESSMSQLETNYSVPNRWVQLQNLGSSSGIPTEGIWIENENSNLNGNIVPASVASGIMNSDQPHEQNLSAFYGPGGTLTYSQADSPSRREIDDDFFEFPDMNFIADNVSELQQGSGTDHVQIDETYTFDQVYQEEFPIATDMEAKCLECGSVAVTGGNQKCMLHE